MNPPTLETMLTSERFFALTQATPVQRAIARAADGRPIDDLASDPRVVAAFDGAAAVAALPVGRVPDRVDVYSGIRTAKSLLASAAAVCMSQRIDVSMIRPGETPRIPILSLDRDKADVVFSHIVGTIMARPLLRMLLVGEPTAESIVLRHPTGVHVEIAPVAGRRAGGALVSRWLGGLVLDEAPRMLGSDDGAVVNIDDALRASAGRILPGGQTWVIGSPWAPWGECFDSAVEFWGRPSSARVVVRAPAADMNPTWWTPERLARLKATNPIAYATDALGEFRADASAAIPAELIDAAFAPVAHPFVPVSTPIGILDSSAGRGDAFTWCLAQWCETRPEVEYEGEVVVEGGFTSFTPRLDAHGGAIRKADQPRPERFLRLFAWGSLSGEFRASMRFDALVARIAQHWRRFDCTRGLGDQFQSWPLESGFSRHGITYASQDWSGSNKVDALSTPRTWFRDGAIHIEAGPLAADVRRELVQLQVRPTSGGGEQIGARRGGHDDLAALVLNAAMLDAGGEFAGSPVQEDRSLWVARPGGWRRA